MSHLVEAGYARCEPPMLQPAAAFFDSGEDMRGRLYLTHALSGEELCLRPEYTIPVCRLYLDSAQAGVPRRFAIVARCSGCAADGPGEFVQAGIENPWPQRPRGGRRRDPGAVAGGRLAGQAGAVRHHDRRCRAVLGPRRRARRPAAMAPPHHPRPRPGQELGRHPRRAHGRQHRSFRRAGGTGRASTRTARGRWSRTCSPSPGSGASGGRTAAEIADRFLEQAALKGGHGVDPAARSALERFLAIEAEPDEAACALRALADDAKLALGPALDRFEHRVSFIAARGVDLAGLRFSGRFIRNLDYYTGFVFETRDAERPGDPPLVGGGRYDRLMGTLGAKVDVPAVGAALWADRRAAGEMP